MAGVKLRCKITYKGKKLHSFLLIYRYILQKVDFHFLNERRASVDFTESVGFSNTLPSFLPFRPVA